MASRTLSTDRCCGVPWSRMKLADLTAVLVSQGRHARAERRTKRQRAGEDDDGDDERDQRVKVEPAGPGREPDDQAGGDDADVAERVAQDVKEDAAHVHRAAAVRVPMRMLAMVVIVVVRMFVLLSVAVLALVMPIFVVRVVVSDVWLGSGRGRCAAPPSGLRAGRSKRLHRRRRSGAHRSLPAAGARQAWPSPRRRGPVSGFLGGPDDIVACLGRVDEDLIYRVRLLLFVRVAVVTVP